MSLDIALDRESVGHRAGRSEKGVDRERAAAQGREIAGEREAVALCSIHQADKSRILELLKTDEAGLLFDIRIEGCLYRARALVDEEIVAVAEVAFLLSLESARILEDIVLLGQIDEARYRPLVHDRVAPPSVSMASSDSAVTEP